MNLKSAVDKSFEQKSLRELCDAPVSALEGVTEAHAAALAALGVKTIGDLGAWKQAAWARAIVELSKLEA
ncbi:MAG: hypothetical protein IT374_05885 [Polyangiaceae bacterium]|nr:hypothetical protein [Polyangiaceae bacterium]